MCGIFGIITPEPKKLDRRAFCVLGVNNDSRGGDSCGIFIDKKYEYGVNEFKLFYNFFPKSKVLNTTIKCQVALGHCRKASVGAINEANAQPVIIKDETGNVQFVLIHNGTIINYLDLAKKYIPQINTTGMTDSQIMAHIFYYTGYEVLGEYLGAGAFVMVDYRNGEPEVLFFKGESKVSQYAVIAQVERPLFCTYSSTEFIFSSTMDYLKALRPGREVMTLSPNQLIQLKKGKLCTMAEYDRTKLWQTQTRSSYIYHNINYGYSPNNHDVNRVCNTINKDSEDPFSPDFNGNYNWDEIIDMDKEGVYMLGGKKAHGLFWVDAMGNVEKKKTADTVQAAFWEGVLLKNAACYGFLAKFARDMDCSHEELIASLPDLVHFLSPCACWKTSKGQWVTSDSPTTNFLYTGTAAFPFTTEKAYFSGGKVDAYTGGLPYSDTFLDLRLSLNYKIDYNALKGLL